MAATNFTPIQLYFSTTASAVPLAANLAQGELAINIADGKLYYEDSAGVVQVIATKGAGTIGGSTTQIQYNNAGALAGNAAMVFNSGTSTTTLTTLNLTNALGATYGGTAQSAYTQGDFLYASATNTLSKLGIGTVNYILTSTGSVPQWVAPSSIAVLTATNLAGGLAGSVPYQSAVNTTTFLSIGAANRVMTSTGTAPQWVTSLTGLTGVSSSGITNTSLTSGRVVVSTTGGLQADDSDLTFDGTTLSAGGLSTVGLSTLVKTVKIGDSSFNGVAVFAAATPAKLYMGTGTVTDVTSAASATNTTGAIATLGITPIAATNVSVTYTNASTLYIAGAPSAGTNITITNPYSLYVAGGASYFGGAVDFAVTPSYSGGTANGVMYLNASKQITTGSALTFDGTSQNLITGAGSSANGAGPAFGVVSNSSADQWYFRLNATKNATIYGYSVAGGGWSNPIEIFSTGLAVTGTLSSTLDATIQGITVGRGAGAVATNTAVGASALAANTSGAYNAAFGQSSLASNTTGSFNTAVAREALYSTTTGSNNTSVGHDNLFNNTTGSNNTAIGSAALQANTTASNNTAVGYQAAYSNTTGVGLTVVGFQAAYANTTGDSNAVFGFYALGNNTTGSNNVAIGRQALVSNTTASNNTAVGYQAGYTNTSGSITALGQTAGYANLTGALNTAIGQAALSTNSTGNYNTAVGYTALQYTTGSSNTAVGTQALNANLSASNNTAVGYQAGYSNTTGSLLTAVGYLAAYANTTGADITAFGQRALTSNTTGSYNTAVGSGALQLNTTGTENVATGRLALYPNTTGGYNTAVGNEALRFNTTASNNTAVGYQAGYSNTIGLIDAYGYQAGYSNTTGTQNTFAGYRAGYSNTTASYNTAFGYTALFSTSTGQQNVALGREVLYSNTTGNYNTGAGLAAMYLNTTGSNNTAVGQVALFSATTGSYNTVLGYNSGNAITTGSKNTILGSYTGNQGGLDIRTASNYIVLSDGDGNPRGIFDGSGNFLVGATSANGVGITLNAGNYVYVATTSNTSAYFDRRTTTGDIIEFRYDGTKVGSISTNGTITAYNVTSDYRLKTVIGPVADAGQRIDALQPVEYTWNADGSRTRGFLAHQFQEVYAGSVTGTKDAVDADGKPVYQAMQASTSEVIADLVAEIQDLRKRLATAGI